MRGLLFYNFNKIFTEGIERKMEKQNYFQPEIECASREQITKWQTEGLIRTVKHAYENSAYYRKRWTTTA